MDFRRFGNKFIVRLDKGEEIVATLKQFFQKQGIKCGTVAGIGAVNKAELGLFKTETKTYQGQTVAGDHELAPLYGNISALNGEVYLHLHANLGNAELNARCGHLKSAVVSATFEAVIEMIDGTIEREFSPEIGLNLLKFK